MKNAIIHPNAQWILLAAMINMTKITTWAKALTNCPLYMAPTPGMKPNRPAIVGLGAPGTLTTAGGGGTAPGCRCRCSLQSCGDARFAIDGAHDVAFAFFAKRFAARTAVRYCLSLIVYGAVHIRAPSCHIKVWAIKLPSRSML